ncbi:MAG: TetR/AcrR family transcriptional regulator [Chitinivibrionia bacterium]|nr:TetR/AcrR family transcriptional regulator [Chitinivibrionia bacterium]
MTRPSNPQLPERILDQAEGIVAAGGSQALNMRRLAEKIGITSTTLYYYFDSKEHILLQLKLRAAWKLSAKMRQIDATWEPRRAIRALGEAYISFAEEHPHLYKLYMETALDTLLASEEDRAALHRSYLAAQSGLEKMAARGLYKHEPRSGTMKGWILLHGFVSLLLAGTLERVTNLSRDELKKVFLDYYVDAVYGESGSAQRGM